MFTTASARVLVTITILVECSNAVAAEITETEAREAWTEVFMAEPDKAVLHAVAISKTPLPI